MIILRPPKSDELTVASQLCLRSKAYWGYDTEFMSACVPELTITEEDVTRDMVILALENHELVGVAQVSNADDGCFLEKLFVNPSHMKKGIGRKLFEWSQSAAQKLGASQMIVEADPDAVPFYMAMNCEEAGSAPSGSIPGRTLPRFICDCDVSKVRSADIHS